MKKLGFCDCSLALASVTTQPSRLAHDQPTPLGLGLHAGAPGGGGVCLGHSCHFTSMYVKNSSTHRVQMYTQAAVVVRYMDSGNRDRNCKGHHISEAFGSQGMEADSQPSEGSAARTDPQPQPQRGAQQLCTQVTRGRPTARLCLAFWTTEIVKGEHYLFLLRR